MIGWWECSALKNEFTHLFPHTVHLPQMKLIPVALVTSLVISGINPPPCQATEESPDDSKNRGHNEKPISPTADETLKAPVMKYGTILQNIFSEAADGDDGVSLLADMEIAAVRTTSASSQNGHAALDAMSISSVSGGTNCSLHLKNPKPFTASTFHDLSIIRSLF